MLHADKRNLILCMFSRQGFKYEPHIEVRPEHFTHKGLPETTYLRPARLATDDIDYVDSFAGKLHADKVKECIDCICEVIRAGKPPKH